LYNLKQTGDSIGLNYYDNYVINPDPVNINGFISITDFLNINTDMNNPAKFPEGLAAMGDGLKDAKNKLAINNPPDYKKLIFLFSDGLQSFGNKLNLDGVSFTDDLDSLNYYTTNPDDSILYFTITTSNGADIPPIMPAIAHNNKGLSLHIDGNSTEFEIFLNYQLPNILYGITPKNVAIRIISIEPFNDSINIPIEQNLSIYFNETVNINTGNIYIKRSNDDSIFEEINITSGKVTGNNTQTLIIDPSNDLESKTEYYILIDENAVIGSDGNEFAGVLSKDYWTFKTVDIEAPTITLSIEDTIVTNSQFEIDIEFSEEVTGFEKSDITITNGTVNSVNSSDNINHTAVIEALGEGTVDISIAANVVKDLSENQNEASELLSITYQTTADINIIHSDDIKVYTSNGAIIIELLNNEYSKDDGFVELYSMKGTILYKEVLNYPKHIIELNNSTKVFIIRITIKNKIYIQKLIFGN
jgi:hypothetical protein